MPRPRTNALLELGGQWLGRIGNSPIYYRHWTDPGTHRTRRASLGTDDFERAKILFAQAVLIKGPKTPDAPLSAVLESYFQERTDKLPSAKHARLAGRLLLECWGDTIRCSQITETKQRQFAEACLARRHSASYISRNLSVCAAAMAHSGLHVHVFFGKRQLSERWSLKPKPPRKVFIPTDDELARFLSADLPSDFFRWCVVACLTGARPGAVLDIAPGSRIRDAGLLNLNPEGRTQNKKYRPTVREPKALKAWLNTWERDRPRNVENWRYCMYSTVESVQTACERARLKTGIPMSVYSFRHKVVTVLRKARIPEDQIALQLGHRRAETGITAGYGEWSPDYLAPAAKALDAWWAKIAKKAKVALKPQPSRKSAKGRKVRPRSKLLKLAA